MEVQISPAKVVQLTERGSVVHSSTGLRSVHACLSYGDYLLAGFERLLRAYGRGVPVEERRVG